MRAEIACKRAYKSPLIVRGEDVTYILAGDLTYNRPLKTEAESGLEAELGEPRPNFRARGR